MLVRVSVSLRSYIHSYTMNEDISKDEKETSFRLLTELYSFLLVVITAIVLQISKEFPSPYGVIFILTMRLFL